MCLTCPEEKLKQTDDDEDEEEEKGAQCLLALPRESDFRCAARARRRLPRG